MEAKKKIVASAILLTILLLSVTWFSKVISSPEFHKKSIEALDEKKVTVMELTAATAATSVTISAIPGDATTPIANQIAELSSYLMIVVGAIMLEKFLITMTGYLTFTYLIPLACVLGIAYLFIPLNLLRKLAIKLSIFGIVICLVIPVSIRISDLVEDTFQVQQAIQKAEQSADIIEKQSDSEEAADEGGSRITKWFSQIGEQITSSVSGAVETVENAMSSFIDAVAALLITTCVIPILVLLFFVWLTKIIFGSDMDFSTEKLFQTRKSGKNVGELDKNSNKISQ